MPFGEHLDGARAHARGQQPVECARRAAALNVPQRRDAHLEAEAVPVVGKVFGQPRGVIFGAFGHDDQRVRLAALPGVAHVAR